MAEAAPVDQETRGRVLSPEQSFIVQAPAGSGKTELLIRRYLSLLAVVSEPEEIVAITFTRKAANEMRERIIRALTAAEEANVGDEKDRDKTSETRLSLATRALTRDRERSWQLIQNPARLKIQTIDALCAWLTQQMPLLSKLGGQPETIEDAGDLYHEAAAHTLKHLDEPGVKDSRLSSWSAAVKTLLLHLDNDLPRARDMLVMMLRKRDQWLRYLPHHTADRSTLENALRHRVEDTLKAARETLPQESFPEFATCLRFATENLEQASDVIEELPGAAACHLDRWQFIVSLCLTKTGNWRKSPTVKQGFPPGTACQDMKDRFKSLLSQFSENQRLLELFQEIRGLPPTGYRDEEWPVLEALCELLVLANAQLQLVFAARNQVDFTGLALAALRSLETAEGPTDLALYLDCQIRHILVDEYQDVSNNQYELLERMTAGWSMEDGHSLFLVGDPMQSIYRFRDAEVGIFLRTREQQRLGQVPVQAETLQVNFRSDRALVEWVNKAFPEVLPKTADAARGAVSFTPASPYHSHERDNRVKIHPILGRDDTLEAELVITLVNTIRAASEGETIAILVRSRSHLQAITARLTQAGLRFRALEIERLETRPVIQDLLALTRALHHPADRVAWLAVLRAPWCGLRLADLLVLSADTSNDTIWHCLQDEQKRAKLSADGQFRTARLCSVLEETYARRRRTSLRRRVESAWLNLGGPATLDTATDLRNANRFFELLDELDEGGDLASTEMLSKRVNKLYAGADVHADDRLQVMSVHKAKGLEFDHVILPGLSRRNRTDDPQLLLWSENPYREHADLLLAPVKASVEDSSPIYDFISRLEKQKQRHEEGRLLYVAATRARKQLHFIGSVKTNDNGKLAKPSDNTLLAQLWPAVEQYFQACLANQAAQTGPEAPPAETQVARVRRLSADWQLPAPPPTVQWTQPLLPGEIQTDPEVEGDSIVYQWAGRTIMHVGTVVHRCIQVLATEGIERWNSGKISALLPYCRNSLDTLGVPEEELKGACVRVEQALQAVLTDARGRWLLTGHLHQASEYALSGLFQGRVVNIVIDRTFVDENGIRWIIDYKTSRHESADVDQFLDLQQERYREQLEKYASVMSAIDDRPIRLGLYFPLLRGWREWAFSS